MHFPAAVLQVCRRGFHDVAATIACKQMGLPLPGRAIAGPSGAGVFGRGSGPIWMDELNCWRNESRLEQCQFAGWGKSACDHSQDVGVACGSQGAPHLNSGCGVFKLARLPPRWRLQGVPSVPPGRCSVDARDIC